MPKEKISSEINDSSNQVLVKNRNILMAINNNYNKIHGFNCDENCSKIGELNNTYIINSSRYVNPYINNNENNNLLFNLISLIKNKLKIDLSDVKEDLNLYKKTQYLEFFKSLLLCWKKKDNKISLINDFRIKLLSEEHLYRNHINLYLMQKIFQLNEAYKFEIKETYNNL